MEKITIKKILPEERETLLNYDQVDKKWRAETIIPKHYNKFLRQGWVQTKIYVDADGKPFGGCFEATARAITIRNADKKKMSEKQLNNLLAKDDEDEAEDEDCD